MYVNFICTPSICIKNDIHINVVYKKKLTLGTLIYRFAMSLYLRLIFNSEFLHFIKMSFNRKFYSEF